MDVFATVHRASSVLPADPMLRTAYLRTRIGTSVKLTSESFSVEGVLVTVIAPALEAPHPTPVVIIDTGLERVAGPVVAGDSLE